MQATFEAHVKWLTGLSASSNRSQLDSAHELPAEREGYSADENCDFKSATMPSDAGLTTILVVEDDPILCQILSRVVIGEARRILQAGNSAEALHLLRECSVQIVLLDLGLREGTGLQLAETLRGRQPQLSVILLSNHRLESSVLRGWTARKLTKSVNLSDLRGAVAAALADVEARPSTETGPCSLEGEPSPATLRFSAKTSLGLTHSINR